MRFTRSRAVGLAVLASLGLCVLATSRSQGFRSWLYSATGEESYLEGLKGVGALALLGVTGPHPQLAPDEPLRELSTGPYGANVFLQLEADPENVRKSYQYLHDGGLTWARQQFPWEDIEIHARGDYEDRRNEPPRSAWDKYDRIVQLAQDHGVELLVRLDDPPDWAFADVAASGDKGPPDDLADYGSFVGEVVKRYCGRVRYYQLWNEPNIFPEWGNRDVDPAGYAALLKVGAAAAREACPGVVIVSAALAQNTEAGGKNMDDLRYLEALYQTGWQADFDVLAAQAFGLFTGPADHRVSADRTNFGRLLLARDIMVRHDDSAKPVWITEMGWTSPPEDYPTRFGRVSEERRAEYTVQAYERIQREWPWVGPAFLWFLRRPDDVWERAPEGYGFFRILGADWSQTPTYQALRRAAAAPPQLYRGRHALNSPGISFSGPWRDDHDPEDRPNKVGGPDAEVQLTFQGTGADILLAPSAADAVAPRLTLVLDGESRSVEPTAGPDGAAIALRNLADGEHLAILRVDEGEARLREVRVTAPDPASPLAPVGTAAVLLVLALVAVAAALLVRRRGGTQASPDVVPEPMPTADDSPASPSLDGS
jgi:hypothetical protein